MPMSIDLRPSEDFGQFSADTVALKTEVVEGEEQREIWLAASTVELDNSVGVARRYDREMWADVARRATDELNLQQGHIRDMSVLTVIDPLTGAALLPVGHLLRTAS
jgi:hypothetical protein